MKYILTLEKYITYKDYDNSKWGTPEEIKEDVERFVRGLLNPIEDKIKDVQYQDLSSDKGIKWEIKVNKDVLHLYKTTTYRGQYEIYLNKKKSTEYDIQQYLLNKYLSDLERYVSSMSSYDISYERSDDSRAYNAGSNHRNKLISMYAGLSNSDKKKAHKSFTKKHNAKTDFKSFQGA